MNNETSIEEKNCLFCKIIAGEIPAEKVYEDEHSLAFLDINPINIGHTLLIPKKHTQNIFDTPSETLQNIVSALKIVSSAVKNGVNADGLNIINNNGGPAGQLVYHLHLHLVPRFTGDGFTHWHGKNYNEGEMSATAEKIKKIILDN
ncbi:MAG: HIT family protein [Candidatus Paceibacterota bacterium]|jgi:histidine triad (HIT) family protein